MADQDVGDHESPPEERELLRQAARQRALERVRALRENLQKKLRELLGEEADRLLPPTEEDAAGASPEQ